MDIAKEYYYKIYNGAYYITTWTKEVINTPMFRAQINRARSAMRIVLARAFDDFSDTITTASNVGEVMDSYSESNANALLDFLGLDAISQSFTGDGGTLKNVVFYLRKTNSPTGNAVAKIYMHSGTFGTSSVPSGTALATSNLLDVSTLSSTRTLVALEFTGANKITLANGVRYVVSLEYIDGGASYISAGVDTTSTSHAGNTAYRNGTWLALATRDLAFYINKDKYTFSEVELNNKVEVWVRDKERPGGKLLYTGYIASYKPRLTKTGSETLEITLFPYDVELDRFILQDSAGLTTVTYTAMDPADILTDAITKYRNRGGQIRYLPQSIQRTNTQITQTFKGASMMEVLNTITQFSPAGFYWYIDGKGVLYFKQKSSVAEHNFAIGLDVTRLETFRRIEDLLNEVYFTGAGDPPLYRYYSNTSSIDEYGRYAKKIIDNRVEEANTAASIANRNINAFKDPEIRSVFHIADSHTSRFGFDIEDVEVGDNMQIKNQKGAIVTPTLWDIAEWDVDVWDQTITSASADVLQIHTIEYNEDKLVLMASSRLPQVSQRIEEIERKLIKKQTSSLPTSPS